MAIDRNELLKGIRSDLQRLKIDKEKEDDKEILLAQIRKDLENINAKKSASSLPETKSQPLDADTVGNNPWTSLARNVYTRQGAEKMRGFLDEQVSTGGLAKQDADNIYLYVLDAEHSPEARLNMLREQKDKAHDEFMYPSVNADAMSGKQARKNLEIASKRFESHKDGMINSGYEDRSTNAEKKIESSFSTELSELDSFIKTATDNQTVFDNNLQTAAEAADAARTAYSNATISEKESLASKMTETDAAFQKAKSEHENNKTQIYYAEGLRSFLSLNQTEQEQLLYYIAMSNSAGDALNTGVYVDFYGNSRNRNNDWESAEAVYKTLKNNLGKEAMTQVEKTLSALYNELRAAKTAEKTAEVANTIPVSASIMSIFTSVVGGVISTADIALQAVSNIGRAKKAPIYYNTPATGASRFTNTTRDVVSKNVEYDLGGNLGKVGAFIYQTGMSGADSILASFLGGNFGSVALASGAAYNAAKDAHDRGATDAQAIWTGIFAGVFEQFFEKYSIGNIKALQEVPIKSIKNYIGNMLKSFAVNASEETATEIANIVADSIINGKASSYAKAVEQYINSGMSEENAREQALKDLGTQIALAGIGGGFMGLGNVALFGTANYIQNKKTNSTEASNGLVDVNAPLSYMQSAPTTQESSDTNETQMTETKSRGNVLWPNGDGTNSLITVEEAERRKAEQEQSGAETGTDIQNQGKKAADAKIPGETPASATSQNNKAVLAAIDLTKAGIGAANDPQAKLISTLSGNISNAVADTVVNSTELSSAFETLTGITLTGTVAQKRKIIKQNANNVSEAYRIKTKQNTTKAVQVAGYYNTTDAMIGEGGALGSFGKAVYRASYQRTTDAYTRDGFGAEKTKQYNAEFGAYYNQGYKESGFSYLNSRMTEAEAHAAYEAGLKDAQITEAATMSARSGILNGASQNEIDIAERLSRVLGKDIIFVNVLGVDAFNGCYTGDGNIYLQVGAKDPIVQIVAHEFTHSLESKGLYKQLRKFVFDYLTKDGKTVEQLRAVKKAKKGYGDKGGDDLDREIVAQFVAEKLMSDERTMREIVAREGKSFGQKLHDALNTFWAKIKAAFGMKTDTDVRSQLDMIERGRALLAEVIRSEDIGDDGGVRYEFLGLHRKIRDYKSDFPEGTSVEVMEEEFKARIATIFNLGAVKLNTDKKKIKVNGDYFTAQKNIFGDYSRKDDSHKAEYKAKMSALYDLVDILETSTYVPQPQSEEIEPSYVDPTISPKNKAHKDVKYWYKFRNTIFFDKQAYDIVFNIRDKGKEQYEYLIEFHKNNKIRYSIRDTAAEAASPVDYQVPYDNRIAQKDPDVKSKDMQNFENDANGSMKIQASYAEDDAAGSPKTPNGEDMPTSNDIRISPFESAEKMLRGGVKFSEVLKQTKLNMRQIALQMQANSASAEDVRALTGLYQDKIGAWHFDEEWLNSNVPDLATNRDLQFAAAKSAFDPKQAGITPGELNRAYKTLKNIGEGARKIIHPSKEEFAGKYADIAAKNAIDLVMREKVPTVDAVLRTGATLVDVAKAMRKKYAESTVLKKTGYFFEEGEWKADQRAMLDLINAAGKDLTVEDYLEFEMQNATEITEDEYKHLYSSRKPYALSKLGIKVASPLADIEASGNKPMLLRRNEEDRGRLKKYIEQTYDHIARPTTAERRDASDVVNGLRTMAQLGEGSRREVVLELVYMEQALRSLKDGGIEMQHFLNKQRFKETVLQTIFGDENAELPQKPMKQWLLSLNTAFRNSVDVFGEKVGEKVNQMFFKPIRENEVNRIRFLNSQTDKIAALKLNEYESAAVQMKAESTEASLATYSELLAEHSKEIDISKVDKAVPVFHEMYNIYYDAINDFLVMHGYKPIGFVKNYMPHVQKDEVISELREQLNALGFETERITELPAEIAGRTEQFKPGKKWTPFFLQRQSERGENVLYDAVSCFDSYVTYISEVLYHTDDIQKLRILNQALRERYSDASVGERIAELRDELYGGNPNRDVESLEKELDEAYGELKKNSLYGTYATWLDEYTDNLAGKQSKFDRIFEAKLGRTTLNLGKKIANQFSAATIVGNLSSAVNQLVQLPIVAAESGGMLNRHMARAFWDITFGGNSLNKTMDFDTNSGFLVGKKGIKYAADSRKARTIADNYNKFIDIAGKPFELTDNFATRLMLRTKFYQLVSANSEIEAETAIAEANEYVEKVVGSRLKGMRPTAFIDKNIASKILTMFQLEATNGWAHIVKDIPREFRQYAKVYGIRKAWKKLLSILASVLLNTFIFNRIAQGIWGQTPAPFDLIGIFVDSLGAGWNVTGNRLLKVLVDNISVEMFGVRFFGSEELADLDVSKFINSGKEEILEDIPLVERVTTIFGVTDGRIPLPKVWDSDISKGADVKQRLAGVGDVVATWIAPGNQIKKTIKGVGVAINHGMRTSSGNQIFAHDNNIWDTIRLAMFGPSALEEYNQYWIDGKTLSKSETKTYDELTAAGAGYEESYDAIDKLADSRADAREKDREEKPVILERIDSLPFDKEYKGILYHNYIATQSEKDAINQIETTLRADKGVVYTVFRDMFKEEEDEDKLTVLEKSKLTDEQKAVVFYECFASTRERELYDELVDGGAEPGEVYALLNADDAADKANNIRESGLTFEQKETAFYSFVSDAWEDEVKVVKSSGGDIDDFAAAYSATRGIVGTKDKNGKTVYLSKSKNLKAAIDKAVPQASTRVKHALYEAFDVSEKVW